jgi:hypothetical protein
MTKHALTGKQKKKNQKKQQNSLEQVKKAF